MAEAQSSLYRQYLERSRSEEVTGEPRAVARTTHHAGATRARAPSAIERVRQSPVARAYAYPGVTVTASVDARSEAGGDFYVVEPMADERLLVIVGDVTGHGLAASVVMHLVYGLVARLAGQFDNASDVLDCVSENMRSLLPAADEGVFATMVVGYIHPRRYVFHVASAGHWPPVAVGPAGPARVLALPNGLPCGVEHHCGASSVDLPLSSGDTVVLYTDGITESRSPSGEQFGVDGLLRALNDAARHHRTVSAQAVREAVARFRGGAPAQDDSTVVAVTLE